MKPVRFLYCEGYYDRAFLAGLLVKLGCTSLTPPPVPQDPWGKPVAGGAYAFGGLDGGFIRVQPCTGYPQLRAKAGNALQRRNVEPFDDLVLVSDADSAAAQWNHGVVHGANL